MVLSPLQKKKKTKNSNQIKSLPIFVFSPSFSFFQFIFFGLYVCSKKNKFSPIVLEGFEFSQWIRVCKVFTKAFFVSLFTNGEEGEGNGNSPW